MNKVKPYVLPAALILGTLLHTYCSRFSVAVPYIIFTILFLNFVAVDLRKLRLSKLDLCLMLFQIVVSFGSYSILRLCGVNETVCEGVLIGVLCPVASAVVVISCALGANRETVTAYTIFGNLMVAIVAPLYFTIIGVHPELGFGASCWLILKRIGTVIGLPFFIALLLQLLTPKVNHFLARFKSYTFYLWACALLFTLGQTIDFIFLHGKGNWDSILYLALAALFFCALQFFVGKKLGKHFGDTIAGGQLLGQKNTAMGIWMANTFLHPLTSVILAFYSIFQNLFNSYQMWRHDHNPRK